MSASPCFRVEELQAGTSIDAGGPIYIELPDDIPNNVEELAREVTADSTTTYEAALALQNWFRS